DAVGSPTSPLDCKAFSGQGNSFLRSPRSASLDGKPRCWDCNRVGLSLVDALMDETEPRGKFLGLSDSSTSAFAPAARINISAGFDKFSGETIGSSCGGITSLSASEIEQSEDYTRIISHGPNPRTTHIFGDCVLESHSFPSEESPPCSSDGFLRSCLSCKKKLEEGKDIYMYKGEKAFCSCHCRDQGILIEEEMEKLAFGSSFHEDMLAAGKIMTA
ncbi:unnamed protein product, partial [Musa textilis]